MYIIYLCILFICVFIDCIYYACKISISESKVQDTHAQTTCPGLLCGACLAGMNPQLLDYRPQATTSRVLMSNAQGINRLCIKTKPQPGIMCQVNGELCVRSVRNYVSGY